MADDEEMTDLEYISYQIERLKEHLEEIEGFVQDFSEEAEIDRETYDDSSEKVNFLLGELDRRVEKIKRYTGYVSEAKLRELNGEVDDDEESNDINKEEPVGTTNKSTLTSNVASSSSSNISSSSTIKTTSSNSVAPPSIIANAIAKKAAMNAAAKK